MLSKSDFVSQVAEATGETKGKTETAVNAVINTLLNAMKRGEEVRFSELGTFSVKDTPARKGRNPATGEEIDVAASKKIVFKQTAGLKGKL